MRRMMSSLTAVLADAEASMQACSAAKRALLFIQTFCDCCALTGHTARTCKGAEHIPRYAC